MNHGMRRTDEMQQKEGWNSMLQFYGNLSSKPSLIPSFLASCKHFDLKDVPPEKDLEATETPHCAYYGNERLMGGRCLLRNNQMAAGAHSRLTQCLPTLITPSCPAVLGLLCHSNDHVPGLETPERTPKGPTFDIWHSWGSDLELASPNVSFKALSSDRGHSGSSWTTTSSMLLDLNLDMGDPPAEDPPAENPPLEDPPDCTLLLSTPGSGTKLPLGLEPKKPSLCLHRSNVIDNKPELPASTSFVDSDSHLRSGHAKSNPSESEKLLNIEDSLSCQGSAVYATFSDTNGNSSTTSGGACSAFDKSAHGSTKETHSPSLTFSDICSTAVNENNVDEGQAMSHNSNWACSTGSTQSVQQWVCNVDAFKSKRGPLRNGSKGEGITDITLQELTQYFSMPITEAAKKLNVGTTVLKKRCREFDIPRWPHRKMKSIDSLITNIMDLAEDQGVKSSHRVLNTVRELEEQRKLMEEMPGIELAERTKKLRQACFKANYKKRRLSMISNKSIDDNDNKINNNESNDNINYNNGISNGIVNNNNNRFDSNHVEYHVYANAKGPLQNCSDGRSLWGSTISPYGIAGFNPDYSAISNTLSCFTKDNFLLTPSSLDTPDKISCRGGSSLPSK